MTSAQDAAIVVNGDAVTVQITVYFELEPADQAEYDDVAGQVLSIPLTFTVTETP